MRDLSVLLLISLEIWQPKTLTRKKDKIKSYLKYRRRLTLEHWPAPLPTTTTGTVERLNYSKKQLNLWVLFKFLCASCINLHWFALRPKAQGWAGWQSSLTNIASSGHLGSSFFLRCDKRHSREALASFQVVLCVCVLKEMTESSNTMRAHFHNTEFYL